MDISHNLISWIRTSISQSSVSFYNDDNLIRSFVQSILLLKQSNIFNVALKQAENVVHYRKQSNSRRC
jgi:ATP-dependent Clp protease adapter protein ClpS